MVISFIKIIQMKPYKYFKSIEPNNYYIIYFNYKNKMLCKFIQVTNFGFNFFNLITQKNVLKHHLYRSKYKRFNSVETFYINKNMVLQKIEKLNLTTSFEIALNFYLEFYNDDIWHYYPQKEIDNLYSFCKFKNCNFGDMFVINDYIKHNNINIKKINKIC